MLLSLLINGNTEFEANYHTPHHAEKTVWGVPPYEKITGEHIVKFTYFTQSGFKADISPAGGQTFAHAPPPGEKLHILLLRWDAKLGDSIVSSFFFRESRKLNARLTVLTVDELAEMHTNTFDLTHVMWTRS